MKLNPDCVRDLLMYFEENTNGIDSVRFDPDNFCDTKLGKYSPEELYYHFKQCEYIGFFINVNNFLDLTSMLLDISPKAHEFLANIRSDNIWEKVKSTAKNVGSHSLNALTQIAASVVATLISQQLK